MRPILSHSVCNRVIWEERVADAPSSDVGENRRTFIIVYALLIVVAVVLYTYQTIAFFRFCLNAALSLHEQMIRAVTRATMQFFHMNSSGRILNRFTKDVGNVDTALPVVINDCATVRHQIHVLRTAVTFFV